MFTLVHGSSACLAINGFSQEDEEERNEEPEECWLQTDRHDAASHSSTGRRSHHLWRLLLFQKRLWVGMQI